jgi:hypothetical protein
MPNLDYHEILFLHILGCDVRIECRDADAVDLLIANYGQMQVDQSASADLDYTVSRCRKRSGFRIARRDGEPLVAADDGDFLFLFEKDLTIELQKLRRDLYFVHAAALALSNRALLLVGPSGKGKSTTAWALLHHGFRYLSDELGPLNLDHLEVQPYPHALCLKKEPPWPYALPGETLRTASTLHIPTVRLPNAAISKPLPLTALFFLEYRPGLNSPGVRQLSKGEAAARFFTHALNPLAHAQDGLAGAAAVAQNVPSFCLDSGDLSLTCGLIKKTLEKAAEMGVHPSLAADRSGL